MSRFVTHTGVRNYESLCDSLRAVLAPCRPLALDTKTVLEALKQHAPEAAQVSQRQELSNLHRQPIHPIGTLS
jgi:hypothetical protein